MSPKNLAIVTILACASSGAVYALNAIYYAQSFWMLSLVILAFPALTLILVPAKYREQRLRIVLSVTTLAGLVGLIYVGEKYVRHYLSVQPLPDQRTALVIHGSASVASLLCFLAWYVHQRKRKQRKMS